MRGGWWILLGALAATAGAQPQRAATVGPALPLPAGPDASGRGLAVADLDGDGWHDVVLATSRGTLGWLKNRGHGRFDAPRTLTQVGPLRSLAVADLDGDGDSDLVVAGEHGTGLVHIETLGDGRFLNHGPVDPEPPWSGLRYPAVRAVLADFDGDGDLDLAGVGRTGALGWARNNGARFGPFFPLSEGRGADRLRDLVAMDVDGDGRDDLVTLPDPPWSVVAPAFNSVVWRRNEGGAFAAPDTLVRVSPGALQIERGDLDGDARDDLVVLTNVTPDGLLQWLSSREGFDRARTLAEQARVGDAFSRGLRVEDFDGDGDDDVLVSARHRAVWIETRREGFGPPVLLAAGAGGAIATGDLDGDGDRDLVRTGERASGASRPVGVSWYEQGGGPWASPRPIGRYRFPRSVAFLDADGDGVVDLLTDERFENAGGRLALYRGAGGGLFRDPTPALLDSAGLGFQPVPVVGGDRAAMVLVQNAGPARAVAWRDSLFVPVPFPLTRTLFRAMSADIDQDGWPDLVASEHQTGVRWWRNAEGVWEDSARVIDSRSYSIDQLAAGDLDGDGDLDVLSGFADQPVVLFNDGATWRRLPVEAPERGSARRYVHIGRAQAMHRAPAAVFVASPVPVPPDPDEPLEPDLPPPVREQLQVEGYNVGVSAFRPNRQAWGGTPCVFALRMSGRYRAITAAFVDFDGDGLDDVLSADGIDGRPGVAACYGTGPFASLTPPLPVAPYFGGADLRVVDVDGDGDLDLVGLEDGVVYWSERVWD